MDVFQSQAFGAYALFTTGLALLLISIDGLGGGFRAKSKTTPNPEDARSVSKGAKVVESDPEHVARVMRAHRNAMANVIPFVLLAFLYVLLGASVTWIVGLMGAFTFFRLVHAFAYIGAAQPWRTLSFGLGQVCTVVLAIQVVRSAIALVS